MPASKESKRTTPKKAKKAVSTAQQWKAGSTYELEVPSGNVCLVKRPDGIKAFMSNGTIPNSLMPLVDQALNGKKNEELDVKSIINDPSQLEDLMVMIDTITVNVVVEPKVHPVPMVTDPDPITGATTPHEGSRDEDKLYVDEVLLDDKLMIMSWAMSGVKDLEQFRKETTDAVATMGDVSGFEDHPLIIAEH